MQNKILEVKDLHFHYGEIHAIKGISFEVYQGEIVTLLGANGAGKTTTLQSNSALIKGISAGEVYFLGEKINGLRPHVIAGKGLAQCLEGRLIFPQLTVMENLMMGAYLCRDKSKTAADLDYVFALFPRLAERRGQNGGTLSGGEQQMLAVGRALMQNPKLLMMDEPSLGLAPLIIEEIFKAIKKINADGIPILLVEQNSNAALQVTDRGYVMETGEIKFTDTAKNLLGNDAIKKAYLGVE
jgi:branched-chain amino acid transport system ATP-binding protein